MPLSTFSSDSDFFRPNSSKLVCSWTKHKNNNIRCFSARFFPLISILKSKMIQYEKQKSCFVRVDLSLHQIGHKWPLLAMFTHDILKNSYKIVVRVIFCNFGTFNFFVQTRPNLSKLVYFWIKNRKNIYGCFFYSICPTDFNSGT